MSYDVIESAVLGDGHFLREEQTLGMMRTEYEYPDLADRSTPDDGADAGSRDIRESAADRVREILSTHYPEYIDPDIDRKIREQFPIKLEAANMKPGNDRW